MKISQKATNKKKIVKDKKPTNGDSKGRFFSGRANFNREFWMKKFKQLIFDKYNH